MKNLVLFSLFIFGIFSLQAQQSDFEKYKKKVEIADSKVKVNGFVLYSGSDGKVSHHYVGSIKKGELTIYYIDDFDGKTEDFHVSTVKIEDLNLDKEPTLMPNGYYEMSWVDFLMGTKEGEVVNSTVYRKDGKIEKNENDILKLSVKDNETGNKLYDLLKENVK